MSIIKGKQNVVAGFGGTKRPLGEVYFSQSSLATDNPGTLPGWTGEYYENGKTLFPDLYNFVKAHSELQISKADYDSAITTYGECLKYVVDENSGTTEETVSAYKITWSPSSKNTDIILSQTPQVGDLLYRFTEPTIEPYPLYAAETHQIEAVGYTDAGVLNSLTISGAAKTVSSLTSVTGTIHIAVAGTSLRLPKYQKTGRYLVKKEVNGNDWYALYSDGWLEQGARYETNVNIEHITFFKPFASVPLVLTSVQSTSRTSYNDFGIDVYNLTTTGFTKQDLRAVGMGWGWEAKGYAAGTPMENIMYPWISAYTSAIPASVAQAAEFIQTVSEMQTSKLDKAASNNFIGFVDTTAGISITLPYTATSNGWICCTWNGDNAYSSGALAIDGVNVFYHLSSARDGRDSYWGNTALIPIRTGQVVTSTGTVPPNGNKLFFPFKNY